MQFKTFSIRSLFTLVLLSLFVVVSCSKDDGNAPTDDTSNTDDTTNDDGDPQSSFNGDLLWVKTFGGSGIDQAAAIVESQDGNYVVVGNTYSADGDLAGIKSTTDSDYWVMKLDKDGNVLWNKVYGDTEDELAYDIAATSEGGYVITGYSRSDNCFEDSNGGFHDYWILKIDGNGNEVWCQNFGYSGSDQANAIIETKEGHIFTGGYFDVTASGGEGNENRAGEGNLHGVGEYWGIKMDSEGAFFWKRYHGGSNNDRCYDVIQTSDDGFMMIGSSESEDFDINDSKGSYDFWVIKLSSDGDLQWTKSYGGLEIDVAYAITPTLDGNFLIAGDTRSSDQDVSQNYGNADMWLIKISPSGNLIWEKSYGGEQFESAKDIVPMGDGTYLITGSSRSSNGDATSNQGQNDAWFILVDSDGTLLMEKNIGGSSLDFSEGVIKTLDGSVVIVGNTESNDGDIPNNNGIKDVLIYKLK